MNEAMFVQKIAVKVLFFSILLSWNNETSLLGLTLLLFLFTLRKMKRYEDEIKSNPKNNQLLFDN